MAPRRSLPAPSRASASPAGQWSAIPFGTAAGAGLERHSVWYRGRGGGWNAIAFGTTAGNLAGTLFGLVPRVEGRNGGTKRNEVPASPRGVVPSGMRFQRAPAEWYQTQYRSTPAVLTAKPSQIIRPLCPSAT